MISIKTKVRIRKFLAVASLGWASIAFGSAPVEDVNPESSTDFIEREVARAQDFMVSAANPVAAQAGYEILSQHGSALDAIIAMQLVLTLTEPQSSGIGGGAFLLYYDKSAGKLSTFDGRETAPAAVDPDLFISDGTYQSYFESVNSGHSVGVPGVLRMFELAHRRHGKLPWHQLFAPAIEAAEQGFEVSPRMHALVSRSKGLAENPAARAYFYDPEGRPWPVGHVLKNPDYTAVLKQLAQQGVKPFYEGDIARDIVKAVQSHPQPGALTLADMAAYKAFERDPVCGDYRIYVVCGMGPPSAGGIGVLQLLGILESFPMAEFDPVGVQAVHYFSEAGRLAYADREYYVADPAFYDVPVQALIDPLYLKARASLVAPDRSMGRAPPGDPISRLSRLGADNAIEVPSTSHLVAVDAQGNVASMTTSVEAAFGSKIFVHGFLLNNQLTDFSHSPVDSHGRTVANRVQGGKRPRSTMAPTIVFREGRPYMAIGSPGGTAIINYVAHALVGVLDWGLDIQEAIALPHYGSRNHQTELERGRGLEHLIEPLEKMGHDVALRELPSGLQGIIINQDGLSGGADPRREGIALGD